MWCFYCECGVPYYQFALPYKTNREERQSAQTKVREKAGSNSELEFKSSFLLIYYKTKGQTNQLNKW